MLYTIYKTGIHPLASHRPMGKADLLKVESECFQELVANADISIVALVEIWLQKSNTTLLPTVVHPIQVRHQYKNDFR